MPHYQGLPPAPYRLAMEAVPELIKLSLLILRDVEPLANDALDYVDEYVEDKPTPAELQYYQNKYSKFQIVFVVVSSIFSKRKEGVSELLPYAISLVPASKRGEVENITAQSMSNLCGNPMFETGVAYMGLDPFSGQWSFFSHTGLIAEMGAKQAFTDEMGLVYDQFFLRTDCDPKQILQTVTVDLAERRLKQYLKHRSKLLYTPFEALSARQIWGVDNALELFVYQEFHRQGCPRTIPQALIYTDGTWHPALYHAWGTFGDDEDVDLISEVDFFFPDQKIAVFCDGATHSRAKIKARDKRIDAALAELGIISLRLTSKRILTDVEEAVACVKAELIARQ